MTNKATFSVYASDGAYHYTEAQGIDARSATNAFIRLIHNRGLVTWNRFWVVCDQDDYTTLDFVDDTLVFPTDGQLFQMLTEAIEHGIYL